MIELKLTSENNHYWNNNGAYQQEMERLYSKFVPMCGCSENLIGEVIRAANRLYYEFCDNGNCNCECGYYDVFTLNKFYGNFIKLIRYYFEQKNCKEGIEAIDEVLRIIKCSYEPEDRFVNKYDRCMDYVIWCVLNDEDNKELIPEWYTND